MYQFVFLLIAPMLCCLAYSYCVFDDARERVTSLIVTRSERKSYYLASALAVFAAGFLIIFIPLFLSQLIYLVAVPFDAYVPAQYQRAFLDDAFKYNQYFRSLANNQPYLYNLLYCLIPALFYTLIGLLSFSLSLFYKKRRFIIITLPYILYIIETYAADIFRFPTWSLFRVALPSWLMSIPWTHLAIFTAALMTINIAALAVKIHGSGDEL